ncbi:LysR family transcriptional regulator [Gordonia sp. CPCC 205515]|uniref:LysR family transcriptional regulator n=1 Tax=Gordonia sp. CPCC 205515 TaxID=3140791 RepID=UPI003AF3C1C1
MLAGNVDLNLLRPLRALLEEQSVSRAAERLNVSQPTASVALGRLRRHFNDPLLVRDGSAYRLTPLALRLRDSVTDVLHATDTIFAEHSPFDPATCTREFVLYATDFVTWRVGSTLCQMLAASAPHATVRFDHISIDVVTAVPASIRNCDGIFLPHGYIDDCPHRDVVEDEWVCLLDTANPHVSEMPTSAELLDLQWVSIHDGKRAQTPALLELRLHGEIPRISVVTPNFLAIPSLVAGTDRVALVQSSLGRWAASTFDGIRAVASPFELGPIREAFWWHPDIDDEPEHRWLREQIAVAAAAFTEPHRPG